MRTIWLSFLVYGTLVSSFAVTSTKGQNQHQQRDAHPPIVDKAIQHAAQHEQEKAGWETNCRNGNMQALFDVAKSWEEKKETYKISDAVDLYKFLADHGTNSYVPAVARLGHYYAEEKSSHEDTSLALNYFMRAADENHHVSMYNAGRIMAQLQDWVGALAYTRAATTLHETHPTYAQERISTVSLEAFAILSQSVAYAPLSLTETADVFLYGSLHDVSDEIEPTWKEAILTLIQVNDTFVTTNNHDMDAMVQAAHALKQLWESHSSDLSPLQQYLVLTHMNGILGPLSASSDDFVPMAAGYAEALALLPYCRELAASVDNSPPFACFNHATSRAMSYYRRMQDEESAKRVLELGQSHSTAATQWTLMNQTPAVYQPQLQTKPFWNSKDFSIANTLEEMYENKGIRGRLLEELQAAKQLSAVGSVEVDASGEMTQQPQLGWTFASNLDNVRTANGKVEGALTELVLYDGIAWNPKACQVIPTLCDALRDDPSLCTTKLCMTDSVIVSLVRLNPGTTILPHCGPTNARLILEFPLDGADGVELVVGGEKTSNNGNGQAIVYDESFEHSMNHGGKQDRIVVRAVLTHPGTQTSQQKHIFEPCSSTS